MDVKLVPHNVFHADRVMRAIRSAAPMIDDWPPVLCRWINDVRTRLDCEPGEYLFDNHGKDKMSFVRVVELNYWMQTQLRTLGARGIRLMPICKVKRHFVRLDVKTLGKIFAAEFPEHPLVKTVQAARKAYADAVTATTGKSGIGDPDNYVLPSAPQKRSKKDVRSVDEWDEYKASLDAHAEEVRLVKVGEPYVRLRALYDALDDARTALPFAFFGGMPRRASGWKFKGSIATDGVAVSALYTRVVKRRKSHGVHPPKEPTAEPSSLDYDRDLASVNEQHVVLGLDPGRNNMAFIAVLYLDPVTGKLVRQRWRLTRGTYYTESGMRSADEVNAKRRAPLTTAFATIATPETTLNALYCSEIAEYVHRVRSFSDSWWKLGLDQNQSYAAMRAFRGKRRVMDGFFSRVIRDVRGAFGKEQRIDIAYGSAGLTMSPTGKGEVAVPTAGLFKACRRVAATFSDVTVTPTDEHCSTKMSWETGHEKEAVYVGQLAGATGGWVKALGHVAGKTMPKVPDSLVDAVKADAVAKKEKKKKRKANADVDSDSGLWKKKTTKKVDVRFPEVGGLRFCPERRLFLNRDLEAACTIARLRVLELTGKARPLPFWRASD
jgi:hypothetical protein